MPWARNQNRIWKMIPLRSRGWLSCCLFPEIIKSAYANFSELSSLWASRIPSPIMPSQHGQWHIVSIFQSAKEGNKGSWTLADTLATFTLSRILNQIYICHQTQAFGYSVTIRLVYSQSQQLRWRGGGFDELFCSFPPSTMNLSLNFNSLLKFGSHQVAFNKETVPEYWLGKNKLMPKIAPEVT